MGLGGPGRNVADNYNYTPNNKNQNPSHSYDLAGNMTNDGAQSLSYDATGQQATASLNAITMGYDGDGLRLKKVENGATTYYLRSTVLGQQTVCEISASGTWQRGYVYLGGQLLAIQDVPQNRVLWTHQEPYSNAAVGSKKPRCANPPEPPPPPKSAPMTSPSRVASWQQTVGLYPFHLENVHYRHAY